MSTQNINDSFEAEQKAGTAFVDLTAACARVLTTKRMVCHGTRLWNCPEPKFCTYYQ